MRETFEGMRIRVHSSRVPVATLSGGNQQKVVLGEMARDATRRCSCSTSRRAASTSGRRPRSTGSCSTRPSGAWRSLVSSSENPELLTLCDRILVVFRGRIAAALSRDEATRGAGSHTSPEATSDDGRRGARPAAAGSLDHAAGVWSAASRYAVVLVLLIAIFVFFSLTQDDFLTQANIENLLTSGSILWVVSIGMTFVVLTGGIDLSVGSLLALSGIILSELFNDVGLPGAARGRGDLPRSAALIGGAVNGVLIGRLGPVVLRRHPRHAGALPGHREHLVGHRDDLHHLELPRLDRLREARSASRTRSGS